MQSELKSLSKIFAETIFRIPDYQRGYSWGLKQLKDFWTDIEQLPSGKSHYTGVLTLEPTKPEDFSKWESDLWIIQSKRYTPQYVVDGQQRLTTAVILIQSIVEHISDDTQLNYNTKDEIRKKYIYESKDGGISRSYIFGYEKDNPSHNFLRAVIYSEKQDIHKSPENTTYTANLNQAKEFFKERLAGLQDSQVEDVFTKLTLHLQFNIFFIEPELDVFVTFETMNNRGKPLSHLELLKNRLIYLSTRFDVEKSEREQLRRAVNESWMTVYDFLGKSASKRLSDDTFLRTHFLCYFGPDLPKKVVEEGEEERYLTLPLHRDEDGYKEYLLDEVFTPKRVQPGNDDPISINDIHRYAQDIRDTVKTYFAVASPENADCSDSEKIVLSQLNRLEHFDFFLFAVATMRKIEAVDQRLALLLAVERAGFLFRLRPYFFTSQKFDLEQDAIRLMAGESSPSEIIRKLENLSDRFATSTDLTDALRGIGKSGNYYYSWPVLRFFMYEYEQHLRRLSKTSRQLLNLETYRAEGFENDHKSVEHIYPQKAVDPYWKNAFLDFSVAERNILRNSLGNLMPVSQPKNSSLSNKSFEIKKGSRTNQVGYRYGCLTEIQVSHEKNWGAAEILRRGISLLSFMEIRWKVPLGTTQNKMEILGLAFVPARLGVTLDNILSQSLAAPLSEDGAAAATRRASS